MRLSPEPNSEVPDTVSDVGYRGVLVLAVYVYGVASYQRYWTIANVSDNGSINDRSSTKIMEAKSHSRCGQYITGSDGIDAQIRAV